MRTTSTTNAPRGFRGLLLDYSGDPHSDPGATRFEPDGLLVVHDGRVLDRGDYEALRSRYPDLDTVDHRGSLIVPGFVDAHVHYPQSSMLAAYGEQLLEWLQNYTYPAELRCRDPEYAAAMAKFFVQELLRNGTTTAAVLCTVHPESVDALGVVAERLNLRLIFGKVLMDRNAPPELCDTPERAYDDSKRLIERWHERGRLLYALTPRFAPTSTPAQLEVTGTLHREHPTTYVHTHLSENHDELAWVSALFPERSSYTDVYDHYGLVTARSIFAHGIHLSRGELELLSERSAAIAFCPTSNLFLGSGLFPLEQVRDAGVSIALGTDVGAGTSFSQLRTASAAYQVLQLQRQRLSAHQGFYLATLGGARAVSLDTHIGNFDPGKEADFVVLDFDATPLLARRSSESPTLEDSLFALMMLGDDRAVRATYVAGRLAHERNSPLIT